MFTRIFPEGCSRETTAFMEECYGKWPIVYLPKDIAKKRDKKNYTGQCGVGLCRLFRL
jgi:hypothetical protein